jgi:hypothetical protein
VTNINVMSNSKLNIQVNSRSIVFKQEDKPPCEVSFIRTLRIPDDGRQYRLPPGFGNFPLRRVHDYADKVPKKWLETDGVFLPIYQREAMWLSFQGSGLYPHAMKISAGGVNALSGEAWTEELKDGTKDLQDYIVCPDQPWLDGFNTGEGAIRQFVAMPMGSGYTVEAQVTGEEKEGGLQLTVYPPKKDKFQKSHSINFGQKQPMLGPYGGFVKEAQELACEGLLEEGHLSPVELESARQKSAQSGDSIFRTLSHMKLIGDEASLDHFYKAQAQVLDVDFVDLSTVDLDPDLARLIPEDLSRRYRTVVISQMEDDVLTLAMIEPLDIIAIDDISLITGFNIVTVQATEEAILKAISQQYGVTDFVEVEETVKDISCQDFGTLDFAPVREFGLASGGQVAQKINADRHGVGTWDQECGVSCRVHLVDIFTWARITGERPPSTPVNAKAYTDAGFPWFDFYDDTHTDLTASEILAEVRSMAQMDALHGLVDKNDESLHVSDQQVVTYVSSSKPIGKG